MDDREIIQWNKRLADQVNRGWDNYKHLHIDLSKARIDEPIRISGEYLYVEQSSSSLAVAKIKLNRNTNDALDLEKGVKIETVFIEVYITNDALQDEWFDLVLGINFKYKKKITDIDGPLLFTTGGPLTTPAGVDLQITPGVGGITQIGDAGVTSHFMSSNDDLFVSGKLEVDGLLYVDSEIRLTDNTGKLRIYGQRGSSILFSRRNADITVLVGNSTGVSPGNVVWSDSIVLAVACIVTQAPGGGPSNFDIGRTAGGNLDEYIDNQSVALDGVFNIAAHNDGSSSGPHWNVNLDTLTVTTTDGLGAPVNVTVADFEVSIVVWDYQISPLT